MQKRPASTSVALPYTWRFSCADHFGGAESSFQRPSSLHPGPVLALRRCTAAIPTCAGGGAGWEGFQGYSTRPTNPHYFPIGASGAITFEEPALCTVNRSSDEFSSQWVMIFDATNGGLVQAGADRDQFNGTTSGCLSDYYEWHKDGSSQFTNPNGGRFIDNTCYSDGTVRQYRVSSTSTTASTARLTFQHGPYPGSLVSDYTTTWTRSAWTNIYPKYSAEVDDSSNDIVGSADHHAVISSIGIQSSDDGGFIYTPCYLAADQSAARGHLSSSGCLTIYTWGS